MSLFFNFEQMSSKKSKIIVLGAGESGVGTAILAKKQGFDVFVSDFDKIQSEYRDVLNSRNISFEENTHDMVWSLLSVTNEYASIEVIKSPGIPDKAPIVKAILEKDIPVISEIEFAGRYTDAKTVCITGSNGKTTTTMLTYYILKNAGYNVGLAGNVGKSFAWQVAEADFDYYVLELSSFQLDGMYRFKADIAVITNITPDHLDRYNYDFQNYVDSKFRILQNQTEDDYFIFWSGDEVVNREIERRDIRARMMPFGNTDKDQKDNRAFMNDDSLVFEDITKLQFLTMDIDSLSLKGIHNMYNSMAAGLVGAILNVDKSIVKQSLATFEGVEHRMEYVATVRGVRYINDSKATNVNSCFYALQSIKTPVVLILGGTDKGNDYTDIAELVCQKVSALIFLGVDNEKLVRFFSKYKNKEGNAISYYEVRSMSECVEKAYQKAKEGDTVLLSPCCASFDLFKNYQDRGEQFKQAVLRL